MIGFYSMVMHAFSSMCVYVRIGITMHVFLKWRIVPSTSALVPTSKHIVTWSAYQLVCPLLPLSNRCMTLSRTKTKAIAILYSPGVASDF